MPFHINTHAHSHPSLCLCLVQVIKQVPRKEIVEVEKRVPKYEYEWVERIVEVPQIHFVDKTVEVPQVQEVNDYWKTMKQMKETVSVLLTRLRYDCPISMCLSVCLSCLLQVVRHVPVKQYVEASRQFGRRKTQTHSLCCCLLLIHVVVFGVSLFAGPEGSRPSRSQDRDQNC